VTELGRTWEKGAEKTGEKGHLPNLREDPSARGGDFRTKGEDQRVAGGIGAPKTSLPSIQACKQVRREMQRRIPWVKAGLRDFAGGCSSRALYPFGIRVRWAQMHPEGEDRVKE